jgi:drug/metabolite transporter (DMT)-like permease
VRDLRTLAAFAAFVIIGGVNFVAVRFSNRELTPLFGAGLRFVTAAIVLLAIVLIWKLPLPAGRALRGTLLYGFLSFAMSYALAYWALTTLPAAIGSLVFASTALFTVVLAPLHGIERFRWRGLLGALITLAGIGILADLGNADQPPLLPLLAMLGSAAAAAESGVILKKAPAAHPIPTNGLAMGLGGVILLLNSMLIGEDWVLPAIPQTWLAVTYLSLIGSVGLFGLFLYVIRRWSASATSYSTALIPVVSAIAASFLAAEPITANLVIGGTVVLAGVYLGALLPARGQRSTVSQQTTVNSQ